METLQALHQRRSIRSFEKDYKIPKEVLEQIVDAALESPTGLDYQGIDLVVVTNRDKINEITHNVLKNWPQSLQDNFNTRHEEYGVDDVFECDASALLLLVKNENAKDDFIKFDAGIMLMSIMASAVNFGLGTLCLGSILFGDTTDVTKSIGKPDGSIVIAIALGKPVPNAKVSEKVRKCKAEYIE